MAKSADVLVKRVAVNGTRTHCRLIVIDGLRGIEEQRGYLLTVRHAQSHKGINACFRGERVRGGQLYLGFRHEQGVQLVHEGSHCAINYVSKDKQRAVLFAYDLHTRYKEPQHNVKLQGLDAGKTYTVKETASSRNLLSILLQCRRQECPRLLQFALSIIDFSSNFYF